MSDVDALLGADVAGLSDEDLMDGWTELGSHAQQVNDRLREFSHEHQRRVRKAQLQRQMDYTEDDLALLQEVVAEGVESKEAVQTGDER
jgi:hypothetical protein